MNKNTYPEVIHIDRLAVPYFVRQSTRAKRLQLNVRRGRLELVVPPRSTSSAITNFLQASREWIKQQHLTLSRYANSFWPSHFVSGETLCLQGSLLNLNIKYAQQLMVYVTEQSVIVQLPWDTPISQVQACCKAAVIAYLKRYAQTTVEKSLVRICTKLGRWPKKIQIKAQSSRWGSCGIHDDIYINWVLILSPLFVLDYVVLHECCHLFHRNHGVRFWQKVASIMPDYTKAEQWLKKYGHYLMQ